MLFMRLLAESAVLLSHLCSLLILWKVFSNGSYKSMHVFQHNMPFNLPGLTEEFDLCCADSVVNVLGYVLLLNVTFKELSPLWIVFEKQCNFCQTAKHISDFLNILTRII